MSLTVDASVFVAAFRPPDVNHQANFDFIAAVRAAQLPIHCPSLVLPEGAGAVSRTTGDALLAVRATTEVRRMPDLRLAPLSRVRSRRAAELAAMYQLRGADSVYVAVAEEFGTTLVTWDGEMHTRGASIVTTMTEWLAAQMGAGN